MKKIIFCHTFPTFTQGEKLEKKLGFTQLLLSAIIVRVAVYVVPSLSVSGEYIFMLCNVEGFRRGNAPPKKVRHQLSTSCGCRGSSHGHYHELWFDLSCRVDPW